MNADLNHATTRIGYSSSSSMSKTSKNKKSMDRDSSFSLPQMDEGIFLSPERERLYNDLAESLRALDLLLEAGAHTKVYSMSMLVDTTSTDDHRLPPSIHVAASSSGPFFDDSSSISDYDYDVEIDI